MGSMASVDMRRGFTIVELLIVVVVIAILASITIVAYSGIQQSSRDSIRKTDIANVAKAISLYNIDNDNLVINVGNCGRFGTGEGWLSHKSSLGGAANYSRSIIDCLRDGKYLQQDIVDPSGCTDNDTFPRCAFPATAYMKVNCTLGGANYVYLLARLETGGQSKPADLNAENCEFHTWYGGQYGMNYAVRVN